MRGVDDPGWRPAARLVNGGGRRGASAQSVGALDWRGTRRWRRHRRRRAEHPIKLLNRGSISRHWMTRATAARRDDRSMSSGWSACWGYALAPTPGSRSPSSGRRRPRSWALAPGATSPPGATSFSKREGRAGSGQGERGVVSATFHISPLELPAPPAPQFTSKRTPARSSWTFCAGSVRLCTGPVLRPTHVVPCRLRYR